MQILLSVALKSDISVKTTDAKHSLC
jgi:hypothetical protein